MHTGQHIEQSDVVPPGLLRGVRILDLTRVLAGPFATSLLADMGAEVIKIENPADPDHARSTPPLINGVSNHFMNINRNKRSLGLDLATPEGRDVFLAMAAKSDVVVENFRPGVMTRLGLGYDSLAAANERIILCSVSGFGQTGSQRTRPAYDVIIQAMSGAMSVTGEEGRPPVRMGVPMGDLSGGLFGAIAILAALYDRTATGRGQSIDVSMLDALTQLMLYYPIDFLNAGMIAGPVGGRHKHIAPYGVLPVKDGYLVLAIFVKKFWTVFCSVIGHEELVNDKRFLRAADRLANRDALYEILEAITRTRTQAEWSEIFDAAGLPYAPVNTVDQVAELPVLREREMFVRTEHPQAGPVFVSGRAIKFPDRQPFTVTPAPGVGEHSGEVLADILGLDPAQIGELRDKHVVL
jgi:crotonobetainyl-CoA:carnitine CoA-transferase CaiB-like acyl-CoA transferase